MKKSQRELRTRVKSSVRSREGVMVVGDQGPMVVPTTHLSLKLYENFRPTTPIQYNTPFLSFVVLPYLNVKVVARLLSNCERCQHWNTEIKVS